MRKTWRAIILFLAVAIAVWLVVFQTPDTRGCEGPKHTSPDGQCFAYYSSASYSEGEVTTQALFMCRLAGGGLGGGNLHSLLPGEAGGIGVEWLDDTTLQLHVPKDQVGLNHKVSHPTQVQMLQRKIDIVRVPILADHPDFHGCMM